MHDSLVPLMAFMGLGTVELLVVGGVVLLLFGSRLPKVMRSLGQGIVEFKRGVQGIEDDAHASSSRNADHADQAAGNG
ncbi:MAG: twin-arginine translocase TatA/TatE family subunit [Planctomycetota bacterium]|nr:twin-arginine translocase TatA/TatE family subunit [Planctomycetota bacterium]